MCLIGDLKEQQIEVYTFKVINVLNGFGNVCFALLFRRFSCQPDETACPISSFCSLIMNFADNKMFALGLIVEAAPTKHRKGPKRTENYHKGTETE